MSEDILHLCIKVADLLKQDPSYREYLENKRLLESDPELFQKVLQFKKSQFDLQIKMKTSSESTFQEEKKLSIMASELKKNKVANDFICSENNCLKLYNEVNKVISTAMDFLIL